MVGSHVFLTTTTPPPNVGLVYEGFAEIQV